ncbi:DEAD/DEAH box helicase [Jiella avicenniae]|uniref:DEAD/DEAH box helicase n=1 Tax=Jiella avicenniae TaxID=2907202 RepID=A0A9X1NZN9_9HYPH|nr:DEAD/DEAH box helicase [Jiella avicenniae]MCE7028457.1 DEAD/DEAH box helicase [Jiella avicenniae]
MFELRPYQRASLDALYSYWDCGGGNPLVVLPTGAGKSLVIAKLVEEVMEQFDIRVAIVTHSKELIEQNFQELLRLWPSAPAGIYSASVGRRDSHAKILFCGIQSVWRKVDLIAPRQLVIVDEAHLIPRNSATMYGKFFERMRDITPDMRVCGLTATPYRLDSGRLDSGADAMFDKIVYEASVIDLIEGGYLSPLISKASAAQVDLSKVSVRGGEFLPASLEAASMAGDLVDRAVSELVAYGQGRKAWLAFCSGIGHANAVRDAIRARGVTAETVDGTMDKGQRESVIRRFRNGEIRCLTSVNVLSIGFNVPHVDLIALMRGTQSTGLYVQQVGRGFRRAHGKKNALILDFANVIRMHGPIDAVSVLPTGSSSGEEKATVSDVRAKECPECESLVALNASRCPHCDHEWPREEKPKHEAEADGTAGILTTERVPPQMIPVVDWELKRWTKAGAPDSIRVDYLAGLQRYPEWVCPEHGGYAGHKASEWWAAHGGAAPFPKTADEALERAGELTAPATISVRPDGKFFRIVGRTFDQRRAA